MSGHQFAVGVWEGLVASAIFAVIVLVVGAAARHWYRTIMNHLEPMAQRTKQLERNGGSHLADAIYEMRDRFDEHLDESAKDRRRLASLERRFRTHVEADNDTA